MLIVCVWWFLKMMMNKWNIEKRVDYWVTFVDSLDILKTFIQEMDIIYQFALDLFQSLCLKMSFGSPISNMEKYFPGTPKKMSLDKMTYVRTMAPMRIFITRSRFHRNYIWRWSKLLSSLWHRKPANPRVTIYIYI